MASANHEEALEFFSIKVADGPLTSKLQKIREGDTILVGRKATGTLIADNLIPGKRLLLLSTGTGLAPFASLIKDPDVYERFESIVLVHGCRQVSELAYGEGLQAHSNNDNRIDFEDYNEWRCLFGNVGVVGHHHGSGAAVPEPATQFFKFATALVFLGRWRFR